MLPVNQRMSSPVSRKLEALRARLDPPFWQEAYPWRRLLDLARPRSLECQELIAALVLEPNGTIVDDLEAGMACNVPVRLEPGMRVSELLGHLRRQFAFALEIDFTKPEEDARFWYVSEEKLEPRLGQRRDEPGAELEMPLDIARRVRRCYDLLLGYRERGSGRDTVVES